jgi:hypothetical protein
LFVFGYIAIIYHFKFFPGLGKKGDAGESFTAYEVQIPPRPPDIFWQFWRCEITFLRRIADF